MRDPNRVNRHGYDPDKICARDDHDRDLKSGTGDAKKDGYSVLARRQRSSFSDEMVSANVADDSMPVMPGWYYD